MHVGHAKCTLSFRCSMPTMLAHMFAKVWVFMREYSLPPPFASLLRLISPALARGEKSAWFDRVARMEEAHLIDP